MLTPTTPGAATVRIDYIVPDPLGTPRLIVDSAGAVLWRWDSDPFGTTAPNEDPAGTGTPYMFNLRFPGQYFDAETGLSYNYMRMYEAGSGRYLESDPVGLAGGVNTYAYAEGNPLRYIDLDGQFAFLLPALLPALEYAATAIVGTMIGVGVYETTHDANEVWGAAASIDNPEAAAEHKAYKTRSRERPPQNLNECERLKWILKREQDVVKAMQDWDEKWLPGEQAEPIRQRLRAIEKPKKEIEEKCGKYS